MNTADRYTGALRSLRIEMECELHELVMQHAVDLSESTQSALFDALRTAMRTTFDCAVKLTSETWREKAPLELALIEEATTEVVSLVMTPHAGRAAELETRILRAVAMVRSLTR